jgi:hypothetical protein
MQKIYTILALWLICCWATPCQAAEPYPFTLENGNVTEGRISVMDEESMVIRRTTGTFSERIDLVYLSQDTLKYIQQHPEYIQKGYHVFVDPFIELPEEEIQPPEITVRQPERMERPDGKTTFFSTLTTPIGLLILGAIYLGNLFAAFEIAIFRGRPIPLVCGISAVLPFIGPILFISMPGIEAESSYEEPFDDGAAAAPEAAPEPAPAPVRHPVNQVWACRREEPPVPEEAGEDWRELSSPKMIHNSAAISSRPNLQNSFGLCLRLPSRIWCWLLKL